MTSASPGGRAQRVHGLSTRESRSQPPACSIFSLQLAQLGAELVGVLDRHLLGDLVVRSTRSWIGRPPPRRCRARPWCRRAAAPGAGCRRCSPARAYASPLDGGVEPRHDLEHGRLARAVGPDDADLRSRQERERDVVEDHLVANGLADVAHRVDVLRHASRLRSRRRPLSAAGCAGTGSGRSTGWSGCPPRPASPGTSAGTSTGASAGASAAASARPARLADRADQLAR